MMVKLWLKAMVAKTGLCYKLANLAKIGNVFISCRQIELNTTNKF